MVERLHHVIELKKTNSMSNVPSKSHKLNLVAVMMSLGYHYPYPCSEHKEMGCHIVGFPYPCPCQYPYGAAWLTGQHVEVGSQIVRLRLHYSHL